MPLFSLFGSTRKPERRESSISSNKFSTEFSEENPSFGNYTSNGILTSVEGDRLKLKYSGLLSKSGAPEVYAVVSYGDNRQWDRENYYRMNNNGRGTFEVSLPVTDNMDINVAFKDGANNWDNNSGKNYSFNSH